MAAPSLNRLYREKAGILQQVAATRQDECRNLRGFERLAEACQLIDAACRLQCEPRDRLSRSLGPQWRGTISAESTITSVQVDSGSGVKFRWLRQRPSRQAASSYGYLRINHIELLASTRMYG